MARYQEIVCPERGSNRITKNDRTGQGNSVIDAAMKLVHPRPSSLIIVIRPICRTSNAKSWRQLSMAAARDTGRVLEINKNTAIIQHGLLF